MPQVGFNIKDLNNWKPWHVAAGNQAATLMSHIFNDPRDGFLALVSAGTTHIVDTETTAITESKLKTDKSSKSSTVVKKPAGNPTG